MFRRCGAVLGTVRIGYKDPHRLPVPCAQRWDLRLAKAKLWNESIDQDTNSAWEQIQDERHMSPEFNTFIGTPTRSMKPNKEGYNTPEQLLNRRLPNQTAFELFNRRDVPYPRNLMFGKLLFDKTYHGVSMPYYYRMFKDLNKAHRNDKKTAQNKFKFPLMKGFKEPPELFTPIVPPEPEDPEDSDDLYEKAYRQRRQQARGKKK